jgi:hypothetical protein
MALAIPRRYAFVIVLAVSALCVAHLRAAVTAQSSEQEAITRTALDYIEGFYTGDEARMQRSLHPDLAKRILVIDPSSGRPRLDHQSAEQLVGLTRRRKGVTPPARQQKDVTVLDVFGNAATVKVIANQWVDYLHVVKWNGEWKIVNVLWEMKPKE